MINDMEWKVIPMPTMEYDAKTAKEGDMYWYHDGKLVYVCNSIEEPRRMTLLERIKRLFCKQ